MSTSFTLFLLGNIPENKKNIGIFNFCVCTSGESGVPLSTPSLTKWRSQAATFGCTSFARSSPLSRLMYSWLPINPKGHRAHEKTMALYGAMNTDDTHTHTMCRVSAGGLAGYLDSRIAPFNICKRHTIAAAVSLSFYIHKPIAADQSRRIISARSCSPSEWPMKNFSCTANLMKKVLSGLRRWFMDVHTRLFAFAKRSDKCLHIDCPERKNFSVCCDTFFTGDSLKFAAGGTRNKVMISNSPLGRFYARECELGESYIWSMHTRCTYLMRRLHTRTPASRTLYASRIISSTVVFGMERYLLCNYSIIFMWLYIFAFN